MDMEWLQSVAIQRNRPDKAVPYSVQLRKLTMYQWFGFNIAVSRKLALAICNCLMCCTEPGEFLALALSVCRTFNKAISDIFL